MADIRDLISRCEESEIFIQNLAENIVVAEVLGKNGQITFLTKPDFIFDEMQGNGKQAFVVWLPKDVFERQEKKEPE